MITRLAVICGFEHSSLDIERILREMNSASAKLIDLVFIGPDGNSSIQQVSGSGYRFESIAQIPDYNRAVLSTNSYQKELYTAYQCVREAVIDHGCDAILSVGFGDISGLLAALNLNLPFLAWVNGIDDSNQAEKTEKSLLYDSLLVNHSMAVITERKQVADYLEALFEPRKVILLDETPAKTEGALPAFLVETIRGYDGSAKDRKLFYKVLSLSFIDESAVDSTSEPMEKVDLFIEKARIIATQLDQQRNWPVMKIYRRFLDRLDLYSLVTEAYSGLIENGGRAARAQGYRLAPGINLQRVPYVPYALDIGQPDLNGIELGLVLDLPVIRGKIGIELISPDGAIVAAAQVPGHELKEEYPVHFDFPPIADSHRPGFWLRVYARDTDVPVRLLEWKKYQWRGFGRFLNRPFCAFTFDHGA